MLILKKILVWLKHHWYIPLAVVFGLVCLIFFPKSVKSRYFQMLLNTRYNYKKQIDIINKNNELEKEKTMDAIKRHQESLAKVEEDFNVKMNELPKKEKKRVEAIVKEFNNDPDKLAEEIANILGADNV
jgi:DNA polymerase II small subunit/DNA polymerase delta subunit B